MRGAPKQAKQVLAQGTGRRRLKAARETSTGRRNNGDGAPQRPVVHDGFILWNTSERPGGGGGGARRAAILEVGFQENRRVVCASTRVERQTQMRAQSGVCVCVWGGGAYVSAI